MLLDSILKLHDKVQNMKLGPNREAEIEQLEQTRLRRLPLAISSGGHDFGAPEPQPLPEPDHPAVAVPGRTWRGAARTAGPARLA